MRGASGVTELLARPLLFLLVATTRLTHHFTHKIGQPILGMHLIRANGNVAALQTHNTVQYSTL